MKRIVIFILLPLGFGLLFFSCEKEGACDEYNVSQSNGSKSHNFGNNCMQCHQSGGEGEGCFVAAGSVKNAALTAPATSGQVEFYTLPNGGGTLKYTVQIDAKGNFYSTEAMTLTGLYPAIKNATGTMYMGSALSSGACNSCHGNSTGALYAN
jgi:mono/diheme cytochrome c family protein